jgi:hypothetical protein
MRVTDLDYVIEDRLVRKLDLMILRCTKKKPVKDAWFAVEGGEGEGKSDTSLAIAYYVKSKTKRDIHMFFHLEPLINFAKIKERKIIIWDEPALDSLKSDVNNRLNKDLQRLIAVCRKKQHFLITNMVRFYRFSENLVVDRCLGMIHLYSKNEMEPGRFVYIRKSRLEGLYRDWNSKKLRTYRSYKSFGGQFSLKTAETIENNIGHMKMFVEGKLCKDYEHYNEIKDEAIGSIGEKTGKNKMDIEIRNRYKELKYRVALLTKLRVMTREKLADHFGINKGRLVEWTREGEKAGFPLEKHGWMGK